MSNHLLVAILGNRDSGKSKTWNYLFDGNVRTGKLERQLYLNLAQTVNVFLINGSPEEREIKVDEIISVVQPHIVLCSTQYREDVTSTFDYFFNKNYEVYVQWLNPGYDDEKQYEDNLGLINYLLLKGATIQIRDGQIDPTSRVKEIRQFILGWAKYRNLINTEYP